MFELKTGVIGLLSLCLLLSAVTSTKVVIINDLHIDPYFDPVEVVQNDCRGPNPLKLLNLTDVDFAPYGRFGCDVPSNLISMLMKKIREFCGVPDVILASGDYAAHDIAAKRGVAQPHYELLTSIITQAFDQYISTFNTSVLIPTIGNNDVKFHYEFPRTPEDSEEYYGYLYDLWFNHALGNRNYTKKKEVKATIMKGGYFTYDYSANLTFVSVNTLYFSVKNEQFNSTVSNEQLDWLESLLRDSDQNRRFVINMHVFPGMYNPGSRQQFWLDEFTTRFNTIMKTYGSKVSLLNGAHTHISDVRASWTEQSSTNEGGFLKGESTQKVPYYANFVSPSISPVFLNNPGFSSFDIDESTGRVTNVTAYFFELDQTYNTTNHGLSFHSVNYEAEFGIKEWSPMEIFNFMNRAQQDDELFKKFLVLKLGYRLDQQEAALQVYKNLNMIDFDNHNKVYWCFFQFMDSQDYDACVAA